MLLLLLHLNTWGNKFGRRYYLKEREILPSIFFFLSHWRLLFYVQEAWPSACAPPALGKTLPFSGVGFLPGESDPH